MKRSLFLLLLLLSYTAFAKTYFVSSIVELTNDLTARTKSVKGEDGNYCALVRVDIPSVNNIAFGPPIVGNPEYLPGEYNVYIPENSLSLTFIADGQEYDIDFSQFNISIENRKCYRVVMSKKLYDSNSNAKVTFNANYDNAVVMIDGIPVGQTPLVLKNITHGKHVISVPNSYGVTMNDMTIDITADTTITLFLHEETVRPVEVESNDNDGGYVVFGVNVKEENGKKGLVDYAGNVLVPFQYDGVFPMIQNGYYVVEDNEKKGLYELAKGLVVPCIYDAIVTSKSYSHDSYMPMSIGGKWGVMSPFGEIIVPMEYENYPQCYEDAISVEEPGYPGAKGLYSYDGNQIVSPKYSYLAEFINGYAFFEKLDESYGFVDKFGNETILPSNYKSSRGIIGNGLFCVKDTESKKWGYMDVNLNLVIPTIYDAMSDYDDAPNFNQGIAMLKLNSNTVIIDNKGKIILDGSNGLYKDFKIVCQSRSWWAKGCFDTYSDWNYGSNTFILVKNDEDYCGLLDVEGNVVVPCRYVEDDIQWFTVNGKNYFVAADDTQISIMDEYQNILLTLPPNLSVMTMEDGLIMVKDQESNSYGYLNMSGEVLANCIYSYGSVDSSFSYYMYLLLDCFPISEGLAVLNIGDRFGFIDNQGNVKVPLNYTAVTPFENGISYVRTQNGEWKKIFKKDL